MMLSFAGTEFVVVEDVSCFDTNAIILKGTTVLTYKPRFADRPFSGSLFGIEVSLCGDHSTAEGSREKHLEKYLHSECLFSSGRNGTEGLVNAYASTLPPSYIPTLPLFITNCLGTTSRDF